jgi:hypothetical protein
MNNFLKFGAMFLVSFVLQVAGTARASDLNVQGSAATGGDASVIRGTIGGPVNFSVTGAFNDTVTVSLRPGATLPPGVPTPQPLTVRELATGSASAIRPLTRISVTQLPDGQTRVLLSIPSALQQFNGGKVALRRGTRPIDDDPIVLRSR